MSNTLTPVDWPALRQLAANAMWIRQRCAAHPDTTRHIDVSDYESVAFIVALVNAFPGLDTILHTMGDAMPRIPIQHRLECSSARDIEGCPCGLAIVYRALCALLGTP